MPLLPHDVECYGDARDVNCSYPHLILGRVSSAAGYTKREWYPVHRDMAKLHQSSQSSEPGWGVTSTAISGMMKMNDLNQGNE